MFVTIDVTWLVLQCSDGLSNKVSNIIRRLMDNMKWLLIYILLLSHSFIILSVLFFINVYMVLFLFNNIMYFYCNDYVFLLYVYVWLP